MSLLTYSGITTKVRAMESRLFTEEQFREMAALEDVHSAADYLKQQPAYAGIFSGLDDSMLHRGNIERLLTLSLYRDFASLYRFGSLKQRRFLDLYFCLLYTSPAAGRFCNKILFQPMAIPADRFYFIGRNFLWNKKSTSPAASCLQNQYLIMRPRGLEPRTNRLRVYCSTN